jgi:cytoskeletal protein CcmA (bactofilin family)
MWQRAKEKSAEQNDTAAKGKIFRSPFKMVETTIISDSSNFQGNIETEGTLIVHGSVRGIIKCGSLEILQEGDVDANVEAESVSVAGKFQGEMICTGRLNILSTGTVIGEIVYGRLSIESGGQLAGNLTKSKPKDTAVLPLYQEINQS